MGKVYCVFLDDVECRTGDSRNRDHCIELRKEVALMSAHALSRSGRCP